MKSDVTVDFSVNVAGTNVYPVAGIFLGPIESEVLDTIYSRSKRGLGPLCPCLDLSLLKNDFVVDNMLVKL